jgi:hypothetical protein
MHDFSKACKRRIVGSFVAAPLGDDLVFLGGNLLPKSSEPAAVRIGQRS